jgi:hypothetical protein
MRSRFLTMALCLVMLSCAGDTDTTAGGTQADEGVTSGDASTSVEATTPVADPSGEDPCALVTPEQVAAAFGATSASGEPGIARNCTFTIEGGLAPTVEVFHYGSSGSWEGVKAGYEDNRGPLAAVEGLGEEAFHPGDVGPYEVVVRAGDVIFAVAVQTGGGGPEVEAAIIELAGEIAGG